MATEVKSDGQGQKKRVSRPSNETFNKNLKQLEATLKEKESVLEKARAAAKNSLPSNSTPNEAREKLHAELKSLKNRQNELKTARNKVLDQVRLLEDSIGKSIKDIQARRGKVDYKSVDEIDKRVSQLETAIESGDLRLVEEKRHLNEISNLKKLRASFAELGSVQASIDSNKEKVVELRKSLDDTEYKEIGSKIGEVLKKLDALRENDQKNHKQRSALFDARTAAEKDRDSVRQEITKLKDDYYGQLRSFNEYLQKEKAEQVEKEKAEQKANEKKKQLEEAEAKVEAAKLPAFAGHIDIARALLAHFDPEFKKEAALSTTADLSNSNGFTSAKRKGGLNTELPEGAKILSKPQNNDSTIGSTKTQKKKSRNDSKLRLNISVIEDLSTLNIAVPTSKDDVANTVAKIKEKIEYYKDNQDRVTAEKVERAEKDLAKLKIDLEKKEQEKEEQAKKELEKKEQDKEQEKTDGESDEKPTKAFSSESEPTAAAAEATTVIEPTSA